MDFQSLCLITWRNTILHQKLVVFGHTHRFALIKTQHISMVIHPRLGSLVIGRKSHNYLLAVKRGNRKIMKQPPSTDDLHGFFPWKIEAFFLQNWSPFESLPFPVDYSMGAMAQLDVLLTHDAALHAALDDLFQVGAEAFWDL